jgi:hypothetical protein
MYPSEEIVKALVLHYDKAPSDERKASDEVAMMLCITQNHAILALRLLVGRKYLLKCGAKRTGVYWRRNPDYPGTLSDAMAMKKPMQGWNKGGHVGWSHETRYDVAGPAYTPPRTKEPYEPKYFQELMSLKKVAEMSRK